MKRKRRTAAAAGILIAVGMLLCLIAWWMVGFDAEGFALMNTVAFTEREYRVEEAFSGITVRGRESGVRLVPSGDSACRVICPESERLGYTVEVLEGVLTVTLRDEREWYEKIMSSYDSPELVVCLPEGEYGELVVETVSGGIEIPCGYSFEAVRLRSTSGSVRCGAEIAGALEAEAVSGGIELNGVRCASAELSTTSGEIRIAGLDAEGPVALRTVSGRIALTDAEAASLAAGTTSGRIALTDVIVRDAIEAGTVSGRIALDGVDAASLKLKTTSGGVEGSILSAKVFDVETTSGTVDVPESTEGGPCEIATVSGSVRITVG